MTIENDDLAILRETTSRTLLAVLWLHVPLAVAIGMMHGADWVVPATLMVAMALASMSFSPVKASRASGHGRDRHPVRRTGRRV